MANEFEIKARKAKVEKLVAAARKAGLSADQLARFTFADWSRLEAIANTRPASPTTRGQVVEALRKPPTSGTVRLAFVLIA